MLILNGIITNTATGKVIELDTIVTTDNVEAIGYLFDILEKKKD